MWNTFHAFNPERFLTESLNVFSSRSRIIQFLESLNTHYYKQLNSHMDEFIGAVIDFAPHLTEMVKGNKLENDVLVNFKNCPHEYQLRRFYEDVMFSSCAYYFPYFPAKSFEKEIQIKMESITRSLVDELITERSVLSWDDVGIRCILSPEEIELLYLDNANTSPKNLIDPQYYNGFYQWIGLLCNHKLGLISLVDTSAVRFNNSEFPEFIESDNYSILKWQ